jgi:hypothetical protein
MKWTRMYLIGFAVLVCGIIAALWKMGVLETIGMAWTLICIVIAVGIGIMFAVSRSGKKETIEIDQKK